MKSLGHVAYDAFRAECGWLLTWNKLPEADRQRWNDLANAAAKLAEVLHEGGNQG